MGGADSNREEGAMTKKAEATALEAELSAEMLDLIREALKGTPGEGVPYLDDAVAVLAKAWRDEAAYAKREKEMADAHARRADAAEAKGDELREKCETAHQDGYAAAMARLGEEARRDAARSLGLAAALAVPAVGFDLLSGELVLASNPYDPCVMDREQLVSALFQARGEMLREKERADAAGRRETEARRAWGLAVDRERELQSEVESLTARLEQMRGRWVDADKQWRAEADHRRAVEGELDKMRGRAEEAERLAKKHCPDCNGDHRL